MRLFLHVNVYDQDNVRENKQTYEQCENNDSLYHTEGVRYNDFRKELYFIGGVIGFFAEQCINFTLDSLAFLVV